MFMCGLPRSYHVLHKACNFCYLMYCMILEWLCLKKPEELNFFTILSFNSREGVKSCNRHETVQSCCNQERVTTA